MLVLRVNKLQNIETDVMIGIGWIEVNYVLHPVRRDGGKNRFDIFSVRVYHADPVAVLDILDDHVEQQHRLAGSGLSKDVHMLAPVLALDAKKLILVPVSGDAEVSDLLI